MQRSRPCQWLAAAEDRGWRVTLIFLWLESAELARRRVEQRVLRRGHDVPAEIVARRWRAGMKNLVRLYPPIADLTMAFNNSQRTLTLVAEAESGRLVQAPDAAVWAKIEGMAHGSD